MKKAQRIREAKKPVLEVHDFEQLAADQASHVEHQTIPGFLRRIPHKWHLNEISRFGTEVGRAAEAMQLVYMTAVDRSLGVIRVFPLPLLERVYTLMGPQFSWPALAEVPALENGRAQREELRKHETAKNHLQAAAEHAPSREVAEALQTVLDWLEAETQRMKAVESPAPLRSI